MDSHRSVAPTRTPPTAGVDATSRSADGDVTRRRQTVEHPAQCGASGEASRAHPYVPDCDIVEYGDGTFLVTHLPSGRTRRAVTDRQALIVGTGLAIAYTWRQGRS
ncbi:hypothetical protein [Nonomuraea sp. NPDC049141]|uniref:hypothetical protein n=1 Tax=Nonomuraea sp. NPDC049141 TaxID=3155500 RepID=UPI0033CFCDAA